MILISLDNANCVRVVLHRFNQFFIISFVFERCDFPIAPSSVLLPGCISLEHEKTKKWHGGGSSRSELDNVRRIHI